MPPVGVTLNAPQVTDLGGGDLDAVVASARAGDEAAFAELWRTLHPPLLRFLAVRGNDSPEDLAAETWIQVLRGLGEFQGGGAQFRAWLFTIARHRAIDHGRARARRPRTVGVDDPAELGSPELGGSVGDTVGASAEQQAIDNESTSRALQLVATLPPAQAEMVALRVVAGLEVADVARLVGKKPGTVRVAVHRALRTLAAHPELRSPRKAV